MNANPWRVGLVVAGSAAFTACGGGGGGSAMIDENVVPASAQVSPEAYTRYVGSLPLDDRRDPVLLDGVKAPVSETAEPLEVG